MISSFDLNTAPLPQTSFKVEQLTVEVYGSSEQLAIAAAMAADQSLQRAIAASNRAAAILATGNSQIQFLEALTAIQGVDWSKVTLFHLDEYLGISSDHPASFRRYLTEKAEQKLYPLRFHYLQGDAELPIEECQRYTQLLAAQTLDLCCLGVGANGHLAFNEPSVANFTDPYWVKLVKLDSTNRHQQVEQGHFSSIDAVPQYAFTLTLPVITSVSKIMCLAPGENKAAVVKTMLEEAISSNCPASILKSKSQATLYLDQDSASLII